MPLSRREALALMATAGAGALVGCSAENNNQAGEDASSQAPATAGASNVTDTDATHTETCIAQARHTVRNNDKSKDPLVLVHASDVHGDADALRRLTTWASDHAAVIDDVLATGDLARLVFSDGMDFWNGVEGAERILTCVGNHDVFDSPDADTRKPYDKVSVADAAARYVDPFAGNWGDIDHKAGTTWYAKDYSERGVRVIVLDCMVYIGVNSADEAADQNAWLEETLEDARAKGLAVVVAEHYPLAEESMVNCSWAPFDRKFAYGPFLASDVPDRVQAFIDSEGIFCCYLCGHCHCDATHVLPDHPDQFALTVPCLSNADDQVVWGDMDRSTEATRDAFNVVAIDTKNGLVKAIRVGANRDLALQKRTTLCWDYRHHHLIFAD